MAFTSRVVSRAAARKSAKAGKTGGRNTARSSRTAKVAGRTAVIAAFSVTLVTPDGESVIECDGDTYILDAAEVCASHTRQLSQTVTPIHTHIPASPRSSFPPGSGKRMIATHSSARVVSRAQAEIHGPMWKMPRGKAILTAHPHPNPCVPLLSLVAFCDSRTNTAGGWHRPPVLLPRGRLLVLRGRRLRRRD